MRLLSKVPLQPYSKGYKPKDVYRVRIVNMLWALTRIDILDESTFESMRDAGKFNRESMRISFLAFLQKQIGRDTTSFFHD